jgi:hypothetical protein
MPLSFPFPSVSSANHTSYTLGMNHQLVAGFLSIQSHVGGLGADGSGSGT